MDQPSNPCPYKPFGIQCMKDYGHGSPHLIEIEAAKVEVILHPKESDEEAEQEHAAAMKALLSHMAEMDGAIPQDITDQVGGLVRPQ